MDTPKVIIELAEYNDLLKRSASAEKLTSVRVAELVKHIGYEIASRCEELNATTYANMSVAHGIRKYVDSGGFLERFKELDGQTK